MRSTNRHGRLSCPGCSAKQLPAASALNLTVAAPLATTVMLGAAVGLLIAGGAADMASAAFRQSMRLAAADDAVRGRRQGVFLVVVVGGPRIADALHGYAAGLVGPGPATTWGGILVLVITVLVGAAVPAFRRYRGPAS